MTAGVKKMVSELHNQSAEKQHKAVENTFYNWKGDEPQVDDVLFMGLKF